jgi:hypothetical protein
MQKHPSKNPARELTQPGAEDGSPAQRLPEDDLASLVDASLFRPERERDHERDIELDDTAGMPNITRMPDGYEVVEQRVGRAVGQWVLQVRCQCGRRWFEVEEIDATTCPRCGLLVYVDVPAARYFP